MNVCIGKKENIQKEWRKTTKPPSSNFLFSVVLLFCHCLHYKTYHRYVLHCTVLYVFTVFTYVLSYSNSSVLLLMTTSLFNNTIVRIVKTAAIFFFRANERPLALFSSLSWCTTFLCLKCPHTAAKKFRIMYSQKRNCAASDSCVCERSTYSQDHLFSRSRIGTPIVGI
jgi:hypothetical protein